MLTFLTFKLTDIVFNNVKIVTFMNIQHAKNVKILTFISMINCMLNLVELEKSFITSTTIA